MMKGMSKTCYFFTLLLLSLFFIIENVTLEDVPNVEGQQAVADQVFVTDQEMSKKLDTKPTGELIIF